EPGPDGVADADVNLSQRDAQEEQGEQEEDDRDDRPGEVGESFAAVDAQRVSDLKQARDDQSQPRAGLRLGTAGGAVACGILRTGDHQRVLSERERAVQMLPARLRPTTPAMIAAMPMSFFPVSLWEKKSAPTITIPTPATDVQIA